VYVYEIATAFTEFYDTEIKKVYVGWLLLCKAVAVVLECSFHILGLKMVECM
jgi:arginyl-tRNA synthetase